MIENTNNNRLINALSCKANENPEQRFTIPVSNREGIHIGTLACVDKDLARNIEIVSNLTNWRKLYMQYFLTQFEATCARTRSWIENVVIPSKDRILFVIYLPTGEVIGNFGVCNLAADSGELDNLIRGIKGGDTRLIYYCEVALLSWMFGLLDYRKSNLHVFSNNSTTIKLHTSVGFKVSDSIKLNRRKSPGLTEYLLNSNEGDPVDFSYLEMTISRDSFLRLHPWVKIIYENDWK